MRCENDFCIYWEENECTLKEIAVNAAGLCDDCILVNIEQDFLKEKRKQLLDKFAYY